MKKLTEKQEAILKFVSKYIEERKFPPTVREIAGNFNITIRTAHDHLNLIEKKGFIRREKKISRGLFINE